MPILDLSELKIDAMRRLEVVRMAEELQSLVNHVYPGCQVVIMRQEGMTPQSAFAQLSATQQIVQVLLESGGRPMELQAIHNVVTKRGGSMSMETLASYLSRGKDEIFVNPSRGTWGLVGPNYQRRIGPTSP